MTRLPERLAGLADVARNLHWSWHAEARAVFRRLDRTLWERTGHNPVELLRVVDPARLDACAADPDFVRRVEAVLHWHAGDLARADTWFAGAHPGLRDHSVAYFCAEFGLHRSVPVYSGGLGALAGDHCKAASDLGVPLVGMGLLYRHGYVDQRVRPDGRQQDASETFDLALTPLQRVVGPDEDGACARVRLAGRDVRIAAWRLYVGRVPVLLLDTDLPSNDPADRGLSGRLYAGGAELRLQQEWILGVGGVRVLRALGIAPAVWHTNEGHAAFMLIERARELTATGVSYAAAAARVRATSVFTTHTPVPAGHDVFAPELVERVLGPVWEALRLDRDAFLSLGHHPTRDRGHFHMTVLALRLSGGVNGVSRVHGEVSRDLWAGLWPDRRKEEIPIGAVTNGVHVGTWMSPAWRAVAESAAASDAGLWAAHQRLKTFLLRHVREEARRRYAGEWQDATQVVGAGALLDPEAFTIGFARRFATYKRAALFFRDGERLRRLLTHPRRPVQILFAGKAHPADEAGKDVLQQVYAFTHDPRFEGRVAFLEDYDLHLARRLVQGVDLWLNLPRVPLEACGTSGMKAALNGVPQLGTLDGWWAEAYDGSNGWAIPAAPPDGDSDAADAAQLYRLLEEEIVPLYYTRDAEGVPRGWVAKMRGAIRVAWSRFTAARMVQEYVDRYYVPAMRDAGLADAAPPD